MSFHYIKFVEEFVIELVEEGEHTFREIAELCHISLVTVRKIVNNYDMFYCKRLNKESKNEVS